MSVREICLNYDLKTTSNEGGRKEGRKEGTENLTNSDVMRSKASVGFFVGVIRVKCKNDLIGW